MDFNKASRQCSGALLTLSSIALLAPMLHAATVGFKAKTSSPYSSAIAPKPLALPVGFGKLPLAFETNMGQADKKTDFLCRGNGYTLSLTSREAVFLLAQRSSKHANPAGSYSGNAATSLHMKLVGGSVATPTAESPLAGKANYLLGSDPAAWKHNVSTFQKVRYAGVYPGVDVVYYGNHSQLEYDFVIKPHADPNQIHMAFDGAKQVRIDRHGELALTLKDGEIHWHKPVVYQTVNGTRRPIDCRYVLTAERGVAFKVARYDVSKPLVIDPVLAYESYLSNHGSQQVTGIAVDSINNIYVTGWTTGTLFATAGAKQTKNAGGQDVFVTKLNPRGNQVIFSTYIGGAGQDIGAGIVVDSLGNPIVTGTTTSKNFPTTVGAPFRRASGGIDAFITKVSADGSAYLYSTYLGGVGSDIARGIAIDPQDQVYIAGDTQSADFPITGHSFKQTLIDPQDGFVAKIDTRLSGRASLIYVIYLGGGDFDSVRAVASGPSSVSGQYSAYVTGSTASADFPIFSPPGRPAVFQSTIGSDSHGLDAFVTKLSPDGSAIEYSTFLGGAGDDIGNAIAVGPTGNAYVAGVTGSYKDSAAQGAFPTTVGAFQVDNAEQANISQPIPNSIETRDAFVTELNGTGSALLYSTYIGGSGIDQANGIALNVFDAVFVTGVTTSPDFPLSGTADQPNFNSDNQQTAGFLIKLDVKKQGTAGLTYSTFIGDSASTEALSIVSGLRGNVYIAGDTTAKDVPTTYFALQSTASGDLNGLIARYQLAAPHDINGDGQSDLLFENSTTNAITYALLNLSTIISTGTLYAGGIDTNFQVVGTPDLNGDGSPDLLFQNNLTGDVYYKLLNGVAATQTGNTLFSAVDLNYKVVGTPDINGDFQPDILFQNVKTGDVVYAILNGTKPVSYGYVLHNLALRWKIVGTPDLLGDGNADLLLQDMAGGDVAYVILNNGNYVRSGFIFHGVDPNLTVAGTADVNGDGHPDILFQNRVNGDISYALMNTYVPLGAYGYIIQGLDPSQVLVGLH